MLSNPIPPTLLSCLSCPAAKDSLDNINLFSTITIVAFFLLTPVALLMEGVQFTPAALAALGVADTAGLLKRALLAGVCFLAYQQVGAGAVLCGVVRCGAVWGGALSRSTPPHSS